MVLQLLDQRAGQAQGIAQAFHIAAFLWRIDVNGKGRGQIQFRRLWLILGQSRDGDRVTVLTQLIEQALAALIIAWIKARRMSFPCASLLWAGSKPLSEGGAGISCRSAGLLD